MRTTYSSAALSIAVLFGFSTPALAQPTFNMPKFGPPASNQGVTAVEPKCVPPIEKYINHKYAQAGSPYLSNSDLEIYINQQTQTMTVNSPDFREPISFKISSGGGLKTPDVRSGKPPYCARTPEIKTRIITAFEPKDFAGRRDCTQDQIRGRSTAWAGNSYRSSTFTNSDGSGVVMPNALRLMGGIFIHQVAPAYKNLLGYNVSGECIRVPGRVVAPAWIQHLPSSALDKSVLRVFRKRDDSTRYLDVSATLYLQMIRHGAMKVTVSPPPELTRQSKQYCDQAMVDARQREIITGRYNPQQATGSEGVDGGVSGFFSAIGNGLSFILGGGGATQSQPQRPVTPERQLTPDEIKTQAREQNRIERQRREADWTKSAFGNN